VLAEISTELNWHTSLIKVFVTEKVVWRLKCCRIKPVLVTLKYHFMHQIFWKWEVVADVVVVVVFVNRKYLKGPSSNIGTLQTSFSIHRVLIPNKIILSKTLLQINLLLFSSSKTEYRNMSRRWRSSIIKQDTLVNERFLNVLTFATGPDFALAFS
jgi:hypothetical protein